MTNKTIRSTTADSSIPAAQPVNDTTANGATVPLPNDPPPAPAPAAPAPEAPPSAAVVATPTTDPAIDFHQALDGARRALTGAQQETIETRRENKQLRAALEAAENARRDAETRVALHAVQTAAAAATPLQAPTAAPATVISATPASPPAPPFPASAINMGASLWGAAVGSSGWRLVLGLFVPLMASFAVGTIMYDLAAFGVTAVATVSGFFLWPILIFALGAIAAVWLMYKTFKATHNYIDSGKAEAHWHTVWGWLSSPLRVVETQDKVLAVEGKVDRLLLTQGMTP